MIKTTRYVCEYCGLQRANLLDMIEHEKVCKVDTLTALQIRTRFKALFNYYTKLGWHIVIRSDGDDLCINMFKKRK